MFIDEVAFDKAARPDHIVPEFTISSKACITRRFVNLQIYMWSMSSVFWRMVYKYAFLLYVFSLVGLILVSPLYGDPAVVFWTAKVMKITGFPYDPVCSKNVQALCVRSPLYYFLLALADNYYRVMLATLLLAFLFFQIRIARGSSNLVLPGLMFPPIYLLFSRTYVDALTALLATVLVWALSEASRRATVIVFIASAMLVLTRETFLTIPLFITLLVVFRVSKKLAGFMAAGWALGLVVYALFLAASGGNNYSDFQPHIPSFNELYKAVYSVFTPVLPWEVLEQDVVHYMSVFGVSINQQPYFLPTFFHSIQAVLHIIPMVFILPIILSARSVLSVNKVLRAQFFYGLFIAGGLLFLKGDLDFFRHTAFLIPSVSVMVSDGVQRLRGWNKSFATFIMMFSLLVFIMYYLRTLRSFFLGYEFDACAYLMKRVEIRDIWFFRSAACG